MQLPLFTREDISAKRVIVRCDFDVKTNEHGEINPYCDMRLDRVVPTLVELLESDAAQIILMGHRGRPQGARVPELSLEPVRMRLRELLGAAGIAEPITLVEDIEADPLSFLNDRVLMLENLRFWKGEKEGDPEFARLLARWGEVYVNDAFGNSHRKDASMALLPRLVPQRFAGKELQCEVEKMDSFLSSIKKPFVVILGGTKISTKLPVIQAFMDSADHILLGGGIASTVLAARGAHVGESVIEKDMLDEAQKLDEQIVHVPSDVVLSDGAMRPVGAVQKDEIILDIGVQTINSYKEIIASARTIMFNGPLGKFEDPRFAHATYEIAKAVAANTDARRLAGGGETIQALETLGIAGKLDFVSTGGGAMLVYISGHAMPALDALS